MSHYIVRAPNLRTPSLQDNTFVFLGPAPEQILAQVGASVPLNIRVPGPPSPWTSRAMRNHVVRGWCSKSPHDTGCRVKEFGGSPLSGDHSPPQTWEPAWAEPKDLIDSWSHQTSAGAGSQPASECKGDQIPNCHLPTPSYRQVLSTFPKSSVRVLAK